MRSMVMTCKLAVLSDANLEQSGWLGKQKGLVLSTGMKRHSRALDFPPARE